MWGNNSIQKPHLRLRKTGTKVTKSTPHILQKTLPLTAEHAMQATMKWKSQIAYTPFKRLNNCR